MEEKFQTSTKNALFIWIGRIDEFNALLWRKKCYINILYVPMFIIWLKGP